MSDLRAVQCPTRGLRIIIICNQPVQAGSNTSLNVHTIEASVLSLSDSPYIEWHVRFSTMPIKALSDQEQIRYPCFPVLIYDCMSFCFKHLILNKWLKLKCSITFTYNINFSVKNATHLQWKNKTVSISFLFYFLSVKDFRERTKALYKHWHVTHPTF